MTQPSSPQIWLVDNDVAAFEPVRSALAQDGYQIVRLSTGREALARSAQGLPDAVIVEVALPDMDGSMLVKAWRQNEFTRYLPVMILTSSGEVTDRLAGFEAGANDYMTKPFVPQELAYRVKNLLALGQRAALPETQAKKKGRIIAVFGTKGGVGKTTLAVNLSLALRRRTKASVALVDCDFFFGDVPLHLKLTPTATVMDLVDRIDQLEPELIEQVLLTHPSGLRVMLSPTQPEQAERITSEHIQKLLEALSDLYNFVIVDLNPSYEDRNLQVLEQADQIMFVIRPELGPIRNMAVFLNLCFKLGLPPEKIHIVLNRADSKSGIEGAQIERSFRSRVEFRMNSGGRAVARSINRGVPLILENPRHKLSKQIDSIADYLVKQSRNGTSGHLPY